jgi:hypothetical protein
VSAPAEVDLDGTNIIPGSGSVTVLTDVRIRIEQRTEQTNLTADKVALTVLGCYKFLDCLIGEVENISGGSITIISKRNITTLTETVGAITVVMPDTRSV